MRRSVVVLVALLILSPVTFAGGPEQPFACPDQYEPDDLPFSTPHLIRNGEVQSRNFCDDTDDWVGFPACAGRTYLIETANLGDLADTILDLYNPSATQLLASDDDGGGFFASRLTWTATQTGTHHVRVRQADASVGSRREYDLRLSGDISACSLWVRTAGESPWEDAVALVQERDGDFLTVGRYVRSTKTDFWFPSFSPEGSGQQPYGTGLFANNIPHALALDTQGGHVAVGETDYWGSGYDSFVFNREVTRPMRWQRTLGGPGDDYSYAIVVTSSGDFTIAGSSTSESSGGVDAWVYRLSTDASIEWQRAVGGPGDEEFYAVAATADDGTILAGYTTTWGEGGKDALVARLDSQGNRVWIRTIGRAGDDQARALVPFRDGSTLVIGSTTVDEPPAFGDIWVVKLSDQGVTQWEIALVGPGDDRALSATATADGGCAIAGYSDSATAGNYDGMLVKIDDMGHLAWARHYGGANADRFSAVITSADGALVLAGYAKSFGSVTADAWVMKATETGLVAGNCAGSGVLPMVVDSPSSVNVQQEVEVRVVGGSQSSLGSFTSYGSSYSTVCDVRPEGSLASWCGGAADLRVHGPSFLGSRDAK